LGFLLPTLAEKGESIYIEAEVEEVLGLGGRGYVRQHALYIVITVLGFYKVGQNYL
jgi:hypothetical protein